MAKKKKKAKKATAKKKTAKKVTKKPAAKKKTTKKVAKKATKKKAAKKVAKKATKKKVAKKVAKKATKKVAKKKTTKKVAKKAAKKVAKKAPATKKVAKKAPAKKATKAEAAPAKKAAKKATEAPAAEAKKGKKAAKEAAPQVKIKIQKEVVLTDAEGRILCRIRDCDQPAVVEGYCRYHYLLYWRKIQARKRILNEGKLEKYIEELTTRYPLKYLEMLKRDLSSEADFLSAIQELEIDESVGDDGGDYEEDDRSFIEEVRGISENSDREENEY